MVLYALEITSGATSSCLSVAEESILKSSIAAEMAVLKWKLFSIFSVTRLIVWCVLRCMSLLIPSSSDSIESEDDAISSLLLTPKR